MSFMRKPDVVHSRAPKNDLGLTRRDYEGGMSTLCAGCGHDAITAAIIESFWSLNVEPHRVVKMSGIGCSSKTPAYFLSDAHGINSVHGRMPSIAAGANAANRDLHYIGVSGDGDSLSIGYGQLAHALRRNLNMLYIIENNGVYGLTKGQFSASADVGTKAKKGDINEQPPIDPVIACIAMGGTFVARGFSGDKAQLVPLIQAGLKHKGFALIDVLSPCVTFNDHEDSTKSYAHTRQFYHPAIHADFIAPAEPIRAAYEKGEAMEVELFDGSFIRLRKVREGYDPTDRSKALTYLNEYMAKGEIITGLMYWEKSTPDLHSIARTSETPLSKLDYGRLSPGAGKLAKIQERYR